MTTDQGTAGANVLNMRRLKKALMAVYGAQDMETADRTGLTFSEVVEVRTEDVAKMYAQGQKRSKSDGS